MAEIHQQHYLVFIAPDKRGYQESILPIFFMKMYVVGTHKKVLCQSASNEYPQRMFSWRNKKKNEQVLNEKKKSVIWSYAILLKYS